MGLKLCGPFTIESVDSEGDKFNCAGLSIEKLNDVFGLCNSDHRKNFADVIGKTYNVHRILTDKDCQTPQELRIFKKSNSLPMIFGYVELFDQKEHEEAKAVKSIVDFYQEKSLSLPLGWSIEVEPITVNKEKVYTLGELKRVALTYKSVNTGCICEVADAGDVLPAQDGLVTKSEKDDAISTVLDKLCNDTKALSKALEAGFNLGPKGTATQGAALQKTSDASETSASGSETSTTTTVQVEDSSPITEQLKSAFEFYKTIFKALK